MNSIQRNIVIALFLITHFSIFGQKSKEISWNAPPKTVEQIKRMDSIAFLCSDTVYREYLTQKKISKNNPAHEVLSLLDKQLNVVLKKLSKPLSKNEKVVLWHLYNMGYIIQTNKQSIGIDIHCRDAKRFAKHIDALLITHRHFDHFRPDLIEEMQRLNKPVISNWIENSYKTDTIRTFSIGNFNITTHLGDHYFWQKNSNNDMLMFEIEVNGLKILHTGDNSSVTKLNGFQNIDVFILHHDIIKSLPEAVALVQPKLTILSHVMELSHSRNKNGYRWIYAHAQEKSKLISKYNNEIMFWGEAIKLR